MLRTAQGRYKPTLATMVDRGHPIANGMIGCWCFNEAGGNQARDAMGQWHGTLTSPLAQPWVFDSGAHDAPTGPNSSPHLGNMTYYQDGTNGVYVDCGAIPLDGNNWTIAVRLRYINGVAGTKRIVAWHGDGPTLWITGGNTLGVVHTSTVDLSGSTGSLANGEKYFFAITRSGARARVYMNTALIASDDAFAASYTADSQFRIGGSSAFGEYSNARFEWVGAWRRGLSGSELAEIFHNPYVFMASQPRWRKMVGIVAGGGGGAAARSDYYLRRRRL